MDNSQPSSWRASNESAKAPFLPYSFTGVYKQLRGIPSTDSACKELLLNLVGDGHIILDNVSLSVGVVPEPATWAMMIIGFGAAGSMIRRRKAVVA